jgi:hypothetical protein
VSAEHKPHILGHNPLTELPTKGLLQKVAYTSHTGPSSHRVAVEVVFVSAAVAVVEVSVTTVAVVKVVVGRLVSSVLGWQLATTRIIQSASKQTTGATGLARMDSSSTKSSENKAKQPFDSSK